MSAADPVGVMMRRTNGKDEETVCITINLASRQQLCHSYFSGTLAQSSGHHTDGTHNCGQDSHGR